MSKEKHKEHTEENKDEDDASVDFSGITSFFKGKKAKDKHKEEHTKTDKEKTDKEEKDEDLQIDLKSVGAFFKRYGFIFLLLIPIILSIYFRVQTTSLPITDDWAKSTVDNYLMTNVQSQIKAQYPNLPPAEFNKLVTDEFQRVKSQNLDAYNSQISSLSQEFKNQLRADDGKTYLLDIDTWYWYRYVITIDQKGIPADEKVNQYDYMSTFSEPDALKGIDKNAKVLVDTHMIAPIGAIRANELHPYVGYYFHKLVTLFNPHLSIMRTFFFVSVLISALAVIPAFFIGRRIAGDMGGFFSAVFIAIHPAFLGRTMAGVVDTDGYNVLFPLLIVWFFFEAYHAKNNIMKYLLLALASFTLAAFSAFWSGWWFMWVFLVLTLIGQIGFTMIHDMVHKEFGKKWKSYGPMALFTLIFMATSLLFVFLISGGDAVQLVTTGIFKASKAITEIKIAAHSDDWPNVYTTVAELNYGSLPGIISQLGGVFLVLLSFFAAIFMIFRERKAKNIYFLVGSFIYLWIIIYLVNNGTIQNTILSLVLLALPILCGLLYLIIQKRQENIMYSLLITLWLLVTFYMSVQGVRFTMLAVSPFSIAVGIALGLGIVYLAEYLHEEFNIKRAISAVILFLLVATLFIAPMKDAAVTAKNEIPLINDAWYNSLTKIKDGSAPNAIITSWWDYGHWFKQVADRPVTFDGASQNSPMAYWVGKALLTDDENTTIGILRMLDCGSNLAYEKLSLYINHNPKTLEVLNQIILLPRDQAYQVLKQYTNDPDKILQYTHCDPPEGYFITSNDMIGKSGVWAHFGIWNMTKANIYNDYKGETKEEFIASMQKDHAYAAADAENLYTFFRTSPDTEINNWIATWPSYMMGSPQACQKSNDTIICQFPQQNGVVPIYVNLTDYDAYVPGSNGKKARLASVVYMADNDVQVKRYDAPDIAASLTVITDGKGSYSGMVTAPEIATSVFNRLYFMGGHGLRYFRMFSDEKAFNGDHIIVWKVDWKGNSTIDLFVPKTAVSKGDSVGVDYIGYLSNGSLFDSSITGWEQLGITKNSSFDAYPSSPLEFTAGVGQMIPGFDNAILGMKLKQETVFSIPPEQAYGKVPGHPLENETLYFKVRVESIQ